jgi:hypothetical protein
MTPISVATLAIIAAMLSMGAAVTSLYFMRERQRNCAPPHDLGDLEQAVEELVRRLEATAGRCIHDLESRESRLRRLLAGEDAADVADPSASLTFAAPSPEPDTPDDTVASDGYFETDLVSRAARARELAEQHADEATICRLLGMQRAELRLVLALGGAEAVGRK